MSDLTDLPVPHRHDYQVAAYGWCSECEVRPVSAFDALLKRVVDDCVNARHYRPDTPASAEGTSDA